jgi:hypothetical protein
VLELLLCLDDSLLLAKGVLLLVWMEMPVFILLLSTSFNGSFLVGVRPRDFLFDVRSTDVERLRAVVDFRSLPDFRSGVFEDEGLPLECGLPEFLSVSRPDFNGVLSPRDSCCRPSSPNLRLRSAAGDELRVLSLLPDALFDLLDVDKAVLTFLKVFDSLMALVMFFLFYCNLISSHSYQSYDRA